MRNYQDVLTFLDSLSNYERAGTARYPFRLDKVTRILEHLGSPERGYQSIHVAGTKGKGSVCTYIASILGSSGKRTGLFTSPHISDPRERIVVEGEYISEEDMCRMTRCLIEALNGDGISYFEAFTLIAMLYFRDRDVDAAVLEVGMGGRYDATNVIMPSVCVITPVSYDHMEFLGKDLGSIAGEKAAIIKKGTRCVSAIQMPEARKVLEERCDQQGIRPRFAGEDMAWTIKERTSTGSRFDIRTSYAVYNDCITGLAGMFQPENAALAVGACEEFAGGKGLGTVQVISGIEKAFIPGRFEVITRDPVMLIDGAQNGHSAEVLKRSIQSIMKYDRLILVVGLSSDKDVRRFCDGLGGLADTVILTKASVKRAMDPSIIRGYISGVNDVIMTGDAREAMGRAFSRAGKKDLIVVTGSFFLVGEIREMVLRREKCGVEE
ncbi:MAG: bifunctional folylpolyglutamate synthase/dihydrofolate synthase [Candidatus Omnitrophica bacterium]|nr:bifunctional folylpolyglutamate synthase/dihydrofolate synthase [Candidatus Omnitrophota bacterium]